MNKPTVPDTIRAAGAAVDLLAYIARCARRGPHGEWVILPGEPHNVPRLGKEFVTEMLDAAGKRRVPDGDTLRPSIDPADEDVQ